ncbi:hypothetical protein FPQ18DRAFT_394676 [Pyronema domesticum]|nr:hypothetical protein FPQ18DRAFT_394676 [Pyronema domesticum]
MVHHHIAAPQSPVTQMDISDDQTMSEPKDTAIPIDPAQDKQPLHLSEIQLKLLRHAEEGKQLSKMLAVADNQSKNAHNLQQQIDQSTKEKDLLTKAYRQLVEETTQIKEQLATVNEHLNKLVEDRTNLEEELYKLKEHRDSTAEMAKQIQQLEEQKAGLEKEVESLRQKEIHLQNEVGNTGQDGIPADMAMAVKRYHEMEEQFGQVQENLVKTVLAEKEKKIVQQVQKNLVENEKKMHEHLQKCLVETEDAFQRKVERRLSKNETMIQKHDTQVQERLELNGQRIQQWVKDSITKNDRQIKKILAEHDQQIKKSITEVSAGAVPVNEQGYLARRIPMKEIPNKMTEITSSKLCIYVQQFQRSFRDTAPPTGLALKAASAPDHMSVVTVRKNMSGNIMLTMSPATTTTDITAHLPLIHEAALSIHSTLQAPRVNEKWHKVAVHGVPTDAFPDSPEGMELLQCEIERNHPVKLAQPPRYISHPDKRVGKAASSVMIALKTAEDAQMLKRTKVVTAQTAQVNPANTQHTNAPTAPQLITPIRPTQLTTPAAPSKEP